MIRSSCPSPRVWGLVLLLGAPLSLLVGCSHELSPPAADAAPPKDDATPPKPDGATDVHDLDDVDAADGGCTCDPGSGFSRGSVSLACYCDGTFGECPLYDDALPNCLGGGPLFSHLEEYADCNYAVITTGNGFGLTRYAYDYTTHQIVGASRSTDYNAYVCGTSRVVGYLAGHFPDATCTRSKVVERCGEPDAGEAGPDAATPSGDAGDATSIDGDAGCACTFTHQGDLSTAWISMDCFCGGIGGPCVGYDEEYARCSGFLPEFSQLEEYADCTLAVITSSANAFGRIERVYDYTTHELVGATANGDVAHCGVYYHVPSTRTGTFPAANCQRTKVVTRCTGDGGDAATALDSP